MNSASKHVMPSLTGGWAVRNYGASRASRTFATQAEALEYGRAAARDGHAALYVHRRDGSVREKSSYGQVPPPATGRR